jgi:hypothetical protein
MIAQEHELSSAKSRRIVRGVFDWIIEVSLYVYMHENVTIDENQPT